ncbi:hypothetical protein [Pseudomonas yamanorum]|uniref:Uncharacterized protein n=1 Tax=Pseudomonas yamanorum TaxID=515393 RepID=A0A7Y8K3X4_9PSED|nr:hypothetical protein [Pseudomonas yamanorum]NWE75147.1 hypothetical protein [Pseudomonas yamanorum]
MSWEVVSCWIESHPGLASWVQAFGSIAAIIAAGYFPIAHEKAREGRDRRNILRTLLYLAEPLENYLDKLSKALLETSYHNRWLFSDYSKKLHVIGKAIDELPASIFVAFEVTLLTDLKFSYQCAVEADRYLQQVSPSDVGALENKLRYRDMCETSISTVQSIREALRGLIEANK